MHFTKEMQKHKDTKITQQTGTDENIHKQFYRDISTDRIIRTHTHGHTNVMFME